LLYVCLFYLLETISVWVSIPIIVIVCNIDFYLWHIYWCCTSFSTFWMFDSIYINYDLWSTLVFWNLRSLHDQFNRYILQWFNHNFIYQFCGEIWNQVCLVCGLLECASTQTIRVRSRLYITFLFCVFFENSFSFSSSWMGLIRLLYSPHICIDFADDIKPKLWWCEVIVFLRLINHLSSLSSNYDVCDP
jgi:hypothetical protein